MGPPSPADPTRTSAPCTNAPDSLTGHDAAAIAPLWFGNPDRYVIVAEHGRGGLGRVSRAHDRGLGRDVAIKELLARSDAGEVRFLREALITARLEHPGIVPVHEAGRWPDGTPFYAMKLVSGRSLRELIAERTTVDERIGLLHHVIAVADAIAYAHDHNIIHRDLKPANVIVGEFGETIVIDWGLAKDLSAPEDSISGCGAVYPTPDDGLTRTGAVLGTPAYMAPEQERGEPVDQRADVFAIGTMLWELCALQAAPSSTQQRDRVLRRAGIDHDLVAIIDKAIDIDPERRYRDAGDLAADLKAFKSGARIMARSYSLLAMLAHWTRRHRALALAAVAFVVVVVASVAALAVLYRSSNRNAETARDNAETARNRLVQSYVEHGRRLLLDGEYLRALPYLSEAYTQGDDSVAMQFLLAHAERLASTQLASHSHAARPRAAAFRPDGMHVLSVSSDGEAAIWDAATGRVVGALPARAGDSYCDVSRDGVFAAIAGPEGLTLWDGIVTRTIATGPAERLAIDASGTRIAIAAGGEISTWNAATGERLWTATPRIATMQLAWSGDAVVVVGVDTVARIASQRGVRTLAATAPVYAIAVGPGGAIATLSRTTVDLWDPAGTRRVKIEGRTRVSSVAFSPDARRVAIGSLDGIVRLYDAASGGSPNELVGHRGGITNMAFSSDGARLATAGHDLTVRIWEVAEQRQIISLVGAREKFGLAGSRFDATGRRVIAATVDGAIRVFDATDPGVEVRVEAGEEAQLAHFVDGGRRFAVSSLAAVQVWSTATGAPVVRFDLPSPSYGALSPDGTKLVIIPAWGPDPSTAADAEVRDVASHALLARLHGATQFRCATFDRASQRIVTCSTGHLVELWDLRGQRLASFRGHGAEVSNAVFSPDDRQILSTSADGTVRIWDIASGRDLGQIAVRGAVGSAEFDASGTRFVTSSSDRVARVWDARTFQLLHAFEHTAMVHHATLDASGSLLASITADGVVSIWDVATSSLLMQFHQAVGMGDVAFSPDGNLLVNTGDGERAVVRRLGRETRSPDVVAAFVRCHVPYRLVETRLEAATPVCSH